MATQITPTTELQAVNTMLSVIGEAPVNSITGTTTVDVSVAKNILTKRLYQYNRKVGILTLITIISHYL